MQVLSVCSQDITFDTNVLSHADNPGSNYQASAVRLLEWMRAAEVRWVLDDTGKAAPDFKTSLLMMEYHDTLSAQSLGMKVLLHCLTTGRFVFVSLPATEVRKKIERLVPRNKRDRRVLGAAATSTDKVLISNDKNDFSDAVRKDVQKSLHVAILDSNTAAAAWSGS